MNELTKDMLYNNEKLKDDGGFNLSLDVRMFISEYLPLPKDKKTRNIDREVFLCMINKDLTDNDIAFATELTVAAVKSRKLRLRKMFVEYYNGTLNKQIKLVK